MHTNKTSRGCNYYTYISAIHVRYPQYTFLSSVRIISTYYTITLFRTRNYCQTENETHQLSPPVTPYCRVPPVPTRNRQILLGLWRTPTSPWRFRRGAGEARRYGVAAGEIWWGLISPFGVSRGVFPTHVWAIQPVGAQERQDDAKSTWALNSDAAGFGPATTF